MKRAMIAAGFLKNCIREPPLIARFGDSRKVFDHYTLNYGFLGYLANVILILSCKSVPRKYDYKLSPKRGS